MTAAESATVSAEETVQTRDPGTTAKSRDLMWDFLVGLVPLIAFAPMLVYEAAALWSRDFMRFVPVTLVALAVIVGLHWPKSSGTLNPYRRWTAVGLYSLAVLLYLLSVWKFAPWLSHVALTVNFCAWVLGRFGNLHWASPVAWTLLLASTIRLPRNWSESILAWLDGTAAWATTMSLDALSIPCLKNGTLLETKGLSLSADVVCGGWGSLFGFMSFAIFVLIVQHRSFFVSGLTVLLVPFWTMLGSYVQLLAITLTHEYSGRDMSAGWDARLLEIAVDGFVLLSIWGSTYLLSRLFDPVPPADAEFGPVFSGLNKLFLWPQPDPIENLIPEDESEKKAFLRRKQKQAERAPAWPPFDWKSDPKAVWLVRLFGVLMLVGMVLPVRRIVSQGSQDINFGTPRVPARVVSEFAGEEALPEELAGGWRRMDFQRTRRSPRSKLGEFEVAWTYLLDDKRFQAAINLPFLGWHDPLLQLRRQGWTVSSEEVSAKDGWAWVETELENELGGTAFSIYSMFTVDGQPFSRLPSRLASSAASVLEEEADSVQVQSDTQLTMQFQIFSESGEPLSLLEKQRVRERFIELREAARKLPVSSDLNQ